MILKAAKRIQKKKQLNLVELPIEIQGSIYKIIHTQKGVRGGSFIMNLKKKLGMGIASAALGISLVGGGHLHILVTVQKPLLNLQLEHWI